MDGWMGGRQERNIDRQAGRQKHQEIRSIDRSAVCSLLFDSGFVHAHSDLTYAFVCIPSIGIHSCCPASPCKAVSTALPQPLSPFLSLPTSFIERVSPLGGSLSLQKRDHT